MSSSPWLVLVTLCIATACGLDAVAREMHVAPAGDDEAAGTHAAPYRTISKAAAIAQPGDTVTVHAGTYREWVQPACGGTGEDARIVYRAAPGETVIIKGSEPITNWADQGGVVWKAVVPNTLFGDYNPFALKLSGGWLHYGNWHSRGDVYLDGTALREQKTPEAVTTTKLSWHAKAGKKVTTIWANFATPDPNKSLTEINVRESIFMPAKSGVSYVTVDGFRLAHSAEN
ncbi:DUF1565 domain-containing protein, partial [bacterium]|nr:DUF1565 domain-containing protein [bacterium]